MPQDIDSILQTLHKGGDVREIRNAIAELIVDRLKSVKDSFGYWEKTHFAYAIAALGWNVNSVHQPTPTWLRLCIVTLEKALLPADKRNENYTPRDEQLDSLTYEQLMADIGSLRKNR